VCGYIISIIFTQPNFSAFTSKEAIEKLNNVYLFLLNSISDQIPLRNYILTIVLPKYIACYMKLTLCFMISYHKIGYKPTSV